MSAAPVDISGMSAAEIKNLIETPEPVVEQPRDEQGRFVAVTEEPVVEEVKTEEAAPVEEFTATIDIGDGAGTQVFSAPTKDELLEKLIEAQTNATRKIRELSAKPAPPPVVEVPALSLDEEAALAQRLLSEPSTAIRKQLEQELGMSLSDVKAKLQQAEQIATEKEGDRVAREFMAATPDFYMHPTNASRIEKYLKLNNLPLTVDSINTAYTDLNGDGLLLKKPVDPLPAAPPARASGLSTRNSVPAPVQTDADIRKKLQGMTLEQMKEAMGYQNIY